MLIDDALTFSVAKNLSQIVALAGDRDAVAAAADDISAELETRHGGAEDFSVMITQEQGLSSFSRITDLLPVGARHPLQPGGARRLAHGPVGLANRHVGDSERFLARAPGGECTRARRD